jgi:Lon protease-like protein
MALRGGRAMTLADLPKTIPVFPLPGVLLLPRGRLPLNIFEPRYLAMTEDALGAGDRLIGMIQPTEPEQPGRPPALYSIGCAGRISSFSETEDGRYLITLTGACRFTVAEEVATMRGYRRVVPDFSRWERDLAAEESGSIARERLLAALKGYFARNGMTADWSTIESSPDERLVTTLAMFCPFEPQEKQVLLECETLTDRAATLIALLEMGSRGGGQGDAAKH